jgi:hypothetical protein
MKKILIYTVIAAGLTIAGCKQELDILSPNQPNIEVFWNNARDAEQGVNAVYSTLHRGPISRWMPFNYIIRSDVGYSASPWADLANATDKFIQTDYNLEPVAWMWSDLYVGAFRANQVLDNVPNIDMDEATKQRFIGEAKFMRGMFYFHLASLWGNVPLMLSSSNLSDQPATSPREQVWAQVEKDLSEAAAVLPVRYENPDDLGRATKGAAYALLAKAQMQQQKYEEALIPLQWLVEGEGSTVYDLVPNYRDNFLVTTENNIESVFEWQWAENTAEFTDDDVATPQHNYGSSLAQFLAPRGIGWSDGQAHRWVVHEFQKEPTVTGQRDPRLPATFIFDSTDVRGPDFTMVYGQTFTERYGRENREVWFRKFLNDHWKNEEGYRSPNNWRFIRYADVLLMYAESLNAVGRTAEAYPHVDRVRQRAGLAPLSVVSPLMSQQEFLEQIKHERLLELTGEGHRWNDLTRWNMLGPQLANRDPAFANFQVGRDELLPIPQRDVDINPNLDPNPNW